MRSAASAMAWEFRRRSRWGVMAVGAYMVVLLIIRLIALHEGRMTINTSETFAIVIVVPMSSCMVYLIGVFTFGLAGDFGACESMYPRRMLTLPVPTSALVTWPMLYGTLAAIALWSLTRSLGIWPSDVDVPRYWPALLAASLLAWAQALTWMPYPLRNLRVIATLLWLNMIPSIALTALYSKASERTMLLILTPFIPLAYATARFAVARARCSDIPEWRLFATRSAARDDAPFASASRAQQWFEWKQHGRSLPMLVAILLPFELALLFVFPDTPGIIFEMLVLALSTPPIMAIFVAATVSQSHARFVVTRPMTTASLIAAKLKVTIWSTLVSWLLVLVAIPIALRWSHTSGLVMGWFDELAQIMGKPRAVVLLLFILAVLMASTWKMLMQSLYAGLSGREWVVKAVTFTTLAILAVALPLLHHIFTNAAAMTIAWNGFPLFVEVLVLIKMIVAGWIIVRVHDLKLVSNRTLIVGALLWNACVFASCALLTWIVPELVIRFSVIAFVAILVTPLARLSAAPLALAWNRHR